MVSESFTEFFKKLFNNDFMPHGHCYFWRPDIVWLNVISDGLIAFSYYAIPLILIFFMLKRKDFPFPSVLLMFGAFILLCGTTHVMAIVTLWDPVYRLDGIIKAATAFISIITMIALIPLVPLALALKSPKELEAANAKLAEANEQLHEIDRLKDNFFSNISHELRTPLTLILSPLESLLANDYGPLNETQRNNLQVMHNNSIRLYQMVNSILDFAKIGTKKIEVKREPLDIVALSKSIVQEFEHIGQQKQVKVSFRCKDSHRIVSMDRYLYERIVFNLLSNAIKFTSQQGSVTCTLTCQDDRLSFSVQDTGIGISEENQKKLFQRFQQVESSATRRFEGTGLGLSLVKEFSLLLGGDVTVKSEADKGSSFCVEMVAPSSELNAMEYPPTMHDGNMQQFKTIIFEEKPLGKETISKQSSKDLAKILVTEDNQELAKYIVSLVRDFAETKHAADGEEASELIKSWMPDLVILDVMMPKRDGISLCIEIKSSPKTAHIPVILLTALTHRDALTRGWEAGADEYLFKPFHPKELMTRVKLLLENSKNNKLLQDLNKKLISSARAAGRFEVASGILHNVGNILNSVNISIHFLLEKLSKSEGNKLKELSQLLKEAFHNPKEFLEDKTKQDNIISFLQELSLTLSKEQKLYTEEINTLDKNIKTINEIINFHQNYKGLSGVVEAVDLPELIDNAISIGLEKTTTIKIIKDYHISNATIDKIRVHQIVVNLIKNAKEAFENSDKKDKQMTIKMDEITKKGKKYLEIIVSDNASGIDKDNLKKIFNFGFSNKKQHKGFGLHISALSAKEMGGSLEAASEGLGCGASFMLLLPIEAFDTEKWIKIE